MLPQTGDCCIGGLVATIYRLGSEMSRGYVPKVQRNGGGPGTDARKRRRKKE